MSIILKSFLHRAVNFEHSGYGNNNIKTYKALDTVRLAWKRPATLHSPLRLTLIHLDNNERSLLTCLKGFPRFKRGRTGVQQKYEQCRCLDCRLSELFSRIVWSPTIAEQPKQPAALIVAGGCLAKGCGIRECTVYT